jgi:hypothetical protein
VQQQFEIQKDVEACIDYLISCQSVGYATPGVIARTALAIASEVICSGGVARRLHNEALVG